MDDKNTIKRLYDRIDINLLLSIILLLGGIWIYLYNIILSNKTMTYFPFIPFQLPPLYCFIHFIISIYLIWAIILCFIKGLLICEIRIKYNINLETLFKYITNLFFKTWIFIIGFSTLSILRSPFEIIGCIGFFIIILIFAKGKSPKVLFYTYITYFIYLIFIGALSYDIIIQNDKPFYDSSDYIVLNITPQGISLKPNYYKISKSDGTYIDYTRRGNTIIIKASDISNDNIIKIEYTNIKKSIIISFNAIYDYMHNHDPQIIESDKFKRTFNIKQIHLNILPQTPNIEL